MARNPAVGYGRPPRHSRFKQGQSGNPKGRPKGSKNLATDLQEELSERINVREGGRSVRLSKQRALVKALLAKALQGDMRAAATLLGLLARTAPSVEPERPVLDAVDLKIVERFAAQVLDAHRPARKKT